jgi:hypothetical protein
MWRFWPADVWEAKYELQKPSKVRVIPAHSHRPAIPCIKQINIEWRNPRPEMVSLQKYIMNSKWIVRRNIITLFNTKAIIIQDESRVSTLDGITIDLSKGESNVLDSMFYKIEPPTIGIVSLRKKFRSQSRLQESRSGLWSLATRKLVKHRSLLVFSGSL